MVIESLDMTIFFKWVFILSVRTAEFPTHDITQHKPQVLILFREKYEKNVAREFFSSLSPEVEGKAGYGWRLVVFCTSL